MKRPFFLAATHLAAVLAGIGIGIYTLPILTAPPAPSADALRAAEASALWRTRFVRELPGSDPLHWGEGEVRLSRQAISFAGTLAPGPAYRLYLAPGQVETAEAFLKVKAQSLPVGEIKSFDGFIVPLAAGVPLENYQSVVVWCEAFSQFITSGRYR